MPLTYDRANQVVSYDPITGHFHWKRSQGSARAGALAGGFNCYGYWRLTIDGVTYKGHRLAFLLMTGRWPSPTVDHINRRPWDNRWCNLREADHCTQVENTGLSSANTSRAKNVYMNKRTGYWYVRVRRNGGDLYAGEFESATEAAIVADELRESASSVVPCQ